MHAYQVSVRYMSGIFNPGPLNLQLGTSKVLHGVEGMAKMFVVFQCFLTGFAGCKYSQP